jgi:hypothetical protein
MYVTELYTVSNHSVHVPVHYIFSSGPCVVKCVKGKNIQLGVGI